MQLITRRLILRDLVPEDWPAVLAYQRDPRYLRFYPWTDRTEAEAQEFVGRFLAWQQERPRRRFQLAITLPQDGAAGPLIGNCGLRRKPPANDPAAGIAGDIAEGDLAADIGYELAPDYWGQGYATEAARAMVNFGFQELGLQRLESWCIADNTASARVLERLGFRQEGRLRRNEYFKGRYWDTLLYGLLREEWQT